MTLPCYLGTCPSLLCADPPCSLPTCDGSRFECAIPQAALHRMGVLRPEPLVYAWPSSLPLTWADKPPGFITELAKRGDKGAKNALDDLYRCRTLALRCNYDMMSMVLLLETLHAANPEERTNYGLHRLQCKDLEPSCKRYVQALLTASNAPRKWELTGPKYSIKHSHPHSRKAQPYR